MKNLHGESTNSKKHSKSAPQTLNDKNSQKTSHHQYTHSKILDSTPKKNHNPHKTHGGNKNPRNHYLNTQSQRHSPKQARSKPTKPKRNREKIRADIRTRCKMEEKGSKPQYSHVKKRKSPAENPRASLRKQRYAEGRRRNTLRKKRSRKSAAKGIVCYL